MRQEKEILGRREKVQRLENLVQKLTWQDIR